MTQRRERPDPQSYFLILAHVAALRSTCVRRAVGCVLVDEDNRVLSTGYNGVPSGRVHCTDKPCPGSAFPSGQGLDECEAIHAEQNAIAFCPDIKAIRTCYVTTSPCMPCTKLLVNTGCELIVFEDDYAHTESLDYWKNAGRKWQRRRTDLHKWVSGLVSVIMT